MDATRVGKATSMMERDLAAFSRSATREFSKADKAHGAMTKQFVANERALAGRGIGAQQLGKGVMAGAAVARSFGTATSASAQLAQSAMRASAFLGAKGLIVGGLIAAGFALKENLAAQKESVRMAEMEFAVRERTREVAARQAAVRADDAVQRDIRLLEAERQLGAEGAKLAERRLQLEEDIAKVRKRQDLPEVEKDKMVRNLENRAQARGALELQQGRRGRAEEMIEKEAKPVLERARRIGLGAEGRRAEDRAVREAERDLRTSARQLADREDMQRRNRLGRPEDWTNRQANADEAQKRARENILEAAGKAKKEGMTDLSDETIEKLATAITTGMDKALAK